MNEMVSNALKHAFPSKKHGEITIDFCPSGLEQCLLTVRDNGIGLPTLDLEKTKSLGLMLIVILVKQLKGNVSFYNQDGAVFQITFSAA